MEDKSPLERAASEKKRPYWHVDAKWISGILLLFLLNVAFFVIILLQATAPEQGIALLSAMLASSFSYEGGGLDATGDIEVMRQKVAESPDGTWQPIPDLQIVVHAADLEGKTPREMRLWFFRQMAEPLYYEGAQGLANLSTDPTMRENILQGGGGVLSLVSAQSHARLLRVLALVGLVSLVGLALLVTFSYRFGKAGSPGCVIFLAALPGLGLCAAGRGALAQGLQAPEAAGGAQEMIQRYAVMAGDALPPVVEKALLVYAGLAGLGLVFVLVWLVGSMFGRERR